jgi:hypothetical protein
VYAVLFLCCCFTLGCVAGRTHEAIPLTGVRLVAATTTVTVPPLPTPVVSHVPTTAAPRPVQPRRYVEPPIPHGHPPQGGTTPTEEPVTPRVVVVEVLLPFVTDTPATRPRSEVMVVVPPKLVQFSLGMLVEGFFEEVDRPWALRVAVCESSGQPDDYGSDAVNSSSRASGWFQHLPKFWEERSEAAGFAGVDIMDPVANVGVAAWLLYDGGGKSHWNESKGCWG